MKIEDLQNAEDLGNLFIDQLADLQSFPVPNGDPVDVKPIIEDVVLELEEAQARMLHQIDHWRQLQGDEEPGDAIDTPLDVEFDRYDYRNVRGRNKRKWYHPNTPVGDRRGYSRRTKKKGACFHVTQPGGAGGFGIAGHRVRHYQKLLASGKFDPGEILKDGIGWDPRALALGDRYAGQYGNQSGVSYQGISSALSVLFYNLPFEWVTWHGNGSNTDFAGFAFDFDTRYDKIGEGPYDGDIMIAHALNFIDDLRDEGHPAEELTIHGAWVAKADPGPVILNEILIPVAEERGMFIDWDFKTNGGTSINEMRKWTSWNE